MENIRELEFSELPLIEQGMILLEKGKHLTQVKRNDYLLNLYSIDNFFVEVYYSVHNNVVEKIEVIKDLSRLDIYIEENKKIEKLRLN